MINNYYRPDIDGLRAIAVISVFFFHLGFKSFSGGFVGVDVFFVISGFLITRLIVTEIEATGRFCFSRFYIRRVRRLFPALYVTILATTISAALILSPSHLERFGQSLLHAIASVSNIYFWIEADYFDESSNVKPLLHTWSLSVEEQFYLFWPATVLLLSRLQFRWLLPLGLLLMATVSLYLNLAFADGNVRAIESLQVHLPEWFSLSDWVSQEKATIFYLLPFRVFEFAIGAGLVWFFRLDKPSNIIMEFCLALGFLLIIGAVMTYDEETLFPTTAALIPCIGAALCIYGGNAKYLGRMLNNRVCVLTGLISYSLYLVHWPVIVLWQYYTFNELSLYEQLAILVLSFLLAAFMYRHIENPFRHQKLIETSMDDVPVMSNRSFLTGMFSLVFLLVLTAGLMASNEGWKWRVDAADISALTPPNTKSVPVEGTDKANPWTHAYKLGSTDNQTDKVLVLGDSHAWHLDGAARYLSSKYNLAFEFYIFEGCPPIFGAYKVYGAPKAIRKESLKQIKCREQTKIWEDYVVSNDFDYVVLSSRWNWLFEPTEYYGTNQRRDLLINKDDPKFSVHESRKVFRSLLERTVKIIQEAGAEVIVFGQVPNIGKDIKGCNDIPKLLFSKEDIKSRCNHVPLKYVLDRSRFSNRVIKEVANKTKSYYVIPTDYFCNERDEYCITLHNNVRLKDDEDHINPFGSVYLAQRWEESVNFPFK